MISAGYSYDIRSGCVIDNYDVIIKYHGPTII